MQKKLKKRKLNKFHKKVCESLPILRSLFLNSVVEEQSAETETVPEMEKVPENFISQNVDETVEQNFEEAVEDDLDLVNKLQDVTVDYMT